MRSQSGTEKHMAMKGIRARSREGRRGLFAGFAGGSACATLVGRIQEYGFAVGGVAIGVGPGFFAGFGGFGGGQAFGGDQSFQGAEPVLIVASIGSGFDLGG